MYNRALHFHFVGIGGSGMSGIAEILLTLGFKVSGSDLSKSAVCARLETLGAVIFEGHRAGNLPPTASLAVYSSAVSQENPELLEAKSRGIPIVRRAEVLAELMRLKFGVGVAGSHGKTSTTSMIGAIMEAGGLDPTVVVGGQVRSTNSGGRLGQGDFLVAETDESDRSFLLLKPTVAVVTNIDDEHLVAYGSMNELQESFAVFVRSVPFYGLSVMCIDDSRVRTLFAGCTGRKISYGISPDAELRLTDVVVRQGHTTGKVWRRSVELGELRIAFAGAHFLLNAVAAAAVGLEFGIRWEVITKALGEFSGVKRRLEVIDTIKGVTIINDYGHHPTEIRATLAAVAEGWNERQGKIIVAFQPHRYTRTRDCFAGFVNAFIDADRLLLTEIYSAGEAPIPHITGDALFTAVSHPDKEFVQDPSALLDLLGESVRDGDVVVFLGAGSIGSIPEKFASKLSASADGKPARSQCEERPTTLTQ